MARYKFIDWLIDWLIYRCLNLFLGWLSIGLITPVLYTPAICYGIFHSCIFHTCNFARIAFCTPAFSVAPAKSQLDVKVVHRSEVYFFQCNISGGDTRLRAKVIVRIANYSIAPTLTRRRPMLRQDTRQIKRDIRQQLSCLVLSHLVTSGCVRLQDGTDRENDTLLENVRCSPSLYSIITISCGLNIWHCKHCGLQYKCCEIFLYK